MAAPNLSILFAVCALSLVSGASPIAKVIQLLQDLHAKVSKEGEEADAVYEELSGSCKKKNQQLGFEIKAGSREVEELSAAIQDHRAKGEALQQKIGDLTGKISSAEQDLKQATEIRHKERSDFVAEQQELEDTIHTLGRAIAVIGREMNKGGASMVQLQSATSLVQAIGALVQATAIGAADAGRLTALVQSSDSSDDSDMGAPAGEVYTSKSGGIVGVLEDLLAKAQAQLDSLTKAETTNQYNFDRLGGSLSDEIKYGNKDMAESKKNLAATSEARSTATGDLDATSLDLKSDKDGLQELKQDCMESANDYAENKKSREEELAAITKAKEIIVEATSFGQTSFVQISTSADLSNYEAVRFIRDLARKNNSPSLSQLASRMAAVMHGTGGFDKVIALIRDMIAKLENEAGADATEKAFCDKEMAETTEKKEDKEQDINKLTTSIDQKSAKSSKLKEQVAELQKALADLAENQATATKIRGDEKALYVKTKSDTEKGLAGVKAALKVLRDYYGGQASHGSASGAGQGIIGLLEVVESDFSKSLAEMIATEEGAASAYDRGTKENQMERKMKEQDAKYKAKEASELDKAGVDATSDRAGIQEELDAVMEYFATLQRRCVAKAESYSDRAAARVAEIQGLKEALDILSSETALVQRKVRRQHHRVLRGGV